MLRQPQVGARETRVTALPIMGEGDPDRAAPRQQRNVEARRRAELARQLLDHLGVVQDRVDALTLRAFEHSADLGLVGDQLVQQLVRLLGGDRLDAQPVRRGQGDRHDPSVDQLP